VSVKQLLKNGDLLPQELIIFIKKGLKIYSDEGVLIKYWPGSNGNEGYMYMYDPGKLPNLKGRFRTIEEFRSHSLKKCILKIEEAILFFQIHDKEIAQMLSMFVQDNEIALNSAATQNNLPVTPPCTTESGHSQQVKEMDPKDFAERELAQGKAPGQVMVALAELYDDMPKWKAAGLALRRPVVDLDEFERDKLKSRFYDRTKKFR
jgi:hypothetical protein